MPIAVGNKFKKKYETEEKKKSFVSFCFRLIANSSGSVKIIT